jgi:hypothetical protein
MDRLKYLKRVHKEFLASQGIDQREYLFISEDAESYTFYHIHSGKEFCFRR